MFGKARWVSTAVENLQGSRVSEAPWFDLRQQGIQPLFQDVVTARAVLHDSGSGKISLQLTWLLARIVLAEAYQGGSVLRIEGAFSNLHDMGLLSWG